MLIARIYHSLFFLPVTKYQTAASLSSQTIISASAHLSSLVWLSAGSFPLSLLPAHLSPRPPPRFYVQLSCGSTIFFCLSFCDLWIRVWNSMWLQEASGQIPLKLKARLRFCTGRVWLWPPRLMLRSGWCRFFHAVAVFVRWSDVK